MPGMFQTEEPVHFSTFGDSGLNPQIGEGQPVICPMLDFSRNSHDSNYYAIQVVAVFGRIRLRRLTSYLSEGMKNKLSMFKLPPPVQ